MAESNEAVPPPFHPRVQVFIDEGRLWRAREYLASLIASSEFDSALCHQLGWVLLQMRDELEAGRYLFASGRRRPAYRAAIALFLDRHRRGGWRQIASHLPPAIRHLPLEDLPEPLAAELTAVGMPPGSAKRVLRLRPPMPVGAKLGCSAAGVLAVLAVLFALACFGVGVPIVLGWLSDRLT